VQRNSPVVRIAAGLAALTCSILLSLDLAGFVPHAPDTALSERLAICESLAAHVAAAASINDFSAARSALLRAVEQDEVLLSAGLREDRGRLIVVAGDHRSLWHPPAEEGSTASHVRMPLQRNGQPWATLEVRFRDVHVGGWLPAIFGRPMVRLFALVAVFGFLSYLVYMRRTLRHLDPSAVIPTRVQAALDVMTEGVLLLDDEARIVLANTSFADRLERPVRSLLGVRIAELGFEAPDPTAPASGLPWVEALREGRSSTGTQLRLQTDSGEQRIFAANGSPVLDGWNRPKGAIVTFDDVTELEHKTHALEDALVKLEKSQEEIRLQNEELEVLARRDPLTGVSNRRAFMDWLETEFERAKAERRELCCIMTDVDHFKRVNDVHGHAAGDEVLRRVAELLAVEAYDSDAVCRYGGEEFCVALPGTGIEAALRIADRMRRMIDSPGFARVPVTASFGVASSRRGARSIAELIDQADQALYAAKHSGRNRVLRYGETSTARAPDDAPTRSPIPKEET
jgi:diguanylate cyclase (GGDEF)-like protein